MILLDKEQTCLLELLKTSLFGEAFKIPNDVNWEKLFEISKAQCIVPLLTSYVPNEYRNAWIEISCQSKARFMQMIHEQNAIVKLLRDNDIHFVILKGTASAIYYPIPSIRTFGDIDIYVSKEKMNLVNRLFENNDYKLMNSDVRHYEYYKNGFEFELHSRFSIIYYKDIEQIVLNGLNDSVDYKICGYSFPGLPTYENGLVLLGHIMQHLKHTGIGLRQVLDWMMFVHNELDDSAWENHFRSLAVEAGLEKLAITVTFMCKKWLGLPNEITWCNSADEEVANQFLLRLFDDGNFGSDRASVENVNKAIREEGIFKYLQRAGMLNWSLAKKYRIFRPVAWIYQLYRYAGNGISGLFSGEKVFRKGKNKMNLEELLRELE